MIFIRIVDRRKRKERERERIQNSQKRNTHTHTHLTKKSSAVVHEKKKRIDSIFWQKEKKKEPHKYL